MIKLTKVERLTLCTLFALLEKTNPKNQEFSTNRLILEEGFTHDYDIVFNSIREEIPKEVCTKVRDILDMYSAIKKSMNALSPPLEIEAFTSKFQGFDGNTESEFMRYCSFTITTRKDFTRLFPDDEKQKCNSHAPMLATYEKMLGVWNSFDKESKYKMNRSQLEQIFNVGKVQ